MLLDQRRPRDQRHFNGCNDERLKLEHGDPVSFIGETRERGQGRGKAVGDRYWGKATGGKADGITGKVREQRGDGDKQEAKGVNTKGHLAIRLPHLPLATDQSF